MSKEIERTDLSRRAFILGALSTAAAVFVDSTIAHIPGLNAIYSVDSSGELHPILEVGRSKPIWETLESGTMGENPQKYTEVLKNMGIHLITPSEGTSRWTNAAGEIMEFDDLDTPSAKLIVDVLSELPPLFYSPRINLNGEKYPLNLGFSRKEISLCICDPRSQAIVVLNKSDLEYTFFNRKGRESIIVHELTHYVTTPRINEFVKNILSPLGIATELQLRDIFKNAIETDSGRGLGYGASNFWEFFSVSASEYWFGKKGFLESYTPYMGTAKTLLLYNNLRDKLFAGSEFPNRVPILSF